MITISHSQAQRLIRGALDRSPPEEQWNALQAHLESCADCRAYRDQRLSVEKSLRRALRARWLASGEPAPGLSSLLTARQHSRARQRTVFVYAGLVLVAFLLLAGFLFARGTDAEGQGSAAALAAGTPTAVFTPTPVRPDGLFQGVLVFEASPGGNSDIFMLEANPGGIQLTNLTESGARDFEPAWSPDGNWIAFLSNRDRGAQGGRLATGADIYVISVAGTRLTRLTTDPTLTWSGPLAWSPDGQWIAATGTHTQALPVPKARNERWIYRVSLEGAPPRMLPYSRGASMPRFSPGLPLLAYLAEEDQLSFLRVYDERSGSTHAVLRGESSEGGPMGPGASVISNFDWTADGRAILYTSFRGIPERDPAQVHLRLVDIAGRIENSSGTMNTTRRSSRVLSIFPSFAPVVSAGLTGDQTLLYSRSYWRGGRGPACRPLESAPRVDSPDLGLPALCVESAIERAAWSTDNRWLALAARETTEDALGIYAMAMPEPGQTELHSERLYDLPAASQALRMRPERSSEAVRPINPRPSRTVLELPAVPPRALLDRALIALTGSSGGKLARLRPDGMGVATLNAVQPAACPRGAPGGGEIAFTVFAQGSDLQRSDIYVMDEAGGNARQITQLMNSLAGPDDRRLPRQVAGQYACPAWSPDGSQLAAWVTTDGQSYLALIPTEGTQRDRPTRYRYMPLNAPDSRPQPIWSVDGRRLLLFIEPLGTRGRVELVSLDVQTGRVTRLVTAEGWSDTSQAALSPRGGWLAYTTLNYSPGGQMQASLRLVNLKTHQLAPPVRLPVYDPLESAGGFSSRGYSSREYGGLSWLSEERLGLVFRGSPDGAVPPALLLYETESSGLTTLSVLEEDLLSAAWSPDGSWVLYSTPSGLWSLNVRGALSRNRAPVWLTGEVAFEINWQ